MKVAGGKATARRGRAKDPNVAVRISLADFVRIVAGEINPVGALLEGMTEVEGDLTVASRLVEMFGGPAVPA
jgi:putative sterol carrier protein